MSKLFLYEYDGFVYVHKYENLENRFEFTYYPKAENTMIYDKLTDTKYYVDADYLINDIMLNEEIYELNVWDINHAKMLIYLFRGFEV